MRIFSLVLFCLAAGLLKAQPKNVVLIEKVPGTGLTPQVAINHKDITNRVASLSNQIVYTLNGGKTWDVAKRKSAFKNFADPHLKSNGKGDFVFLQSAGLGSNSTDSVRDRITSQSTGDGGVTWSEETFHSYRPPHGQALPRVGKEHGTLYLAWTELDQDIQEKSPCGANILFSMSSSEGRKWSDPIQINTLSGPCGDGGWRMQSQPPVMSADGKLFVLWSNNGSSFLDRSYDGGKTWLSTDLPAARADQITPMPVMGVQTAVDVPAFAVDKSMSYFRSSLYLVWSGPGKGASDKDIWFSRSTNRGDFWTESQVISKDSLHRHQFLPSLSVDDATGLLYIAYYDQRAQEDGRADVYLAYSFDGGSTFSEMKVNEEPILATAEFPLAGPVAIDAYKGVIMLTWPRVEGGTTNLLSATLLQSDVIKKQDTPRLQVIHKR